MKSLVVSLFMTIAAQDAEDAAAYTFRVGTRWTYSTHKGEKTRNTFSARVTKTENGQTYLSYETQDTSARLPRSNEEVWWVENGGLCFATILDGKPFDAQMLYKFGSKKGDAWANSLGDTTATNEGRVEVKVPAGSYKDAIQIKIKADLDGHVVANYWLVPKVGWVKLIVGPITIELEKFEEPAK